MRSKIKKPVEIIFAFGITLCLFSFICPLEKKNYPKELIGKWQFIEMLDEKGVHVDTIPSPTGKLIVNEPQYVFNEDGSYSARFTETSSNTGTWTYNNKHKEVILKLYWKKPYTEIDRYIATLGYAKQDKSGDYFDLIPKKIIELTSNKMIISDKENHQIIYKKVN